jgi:hypothetical protein
MADIPDTRPIPDPTILTTEASARLEKALRAQILSEVAHLNVLFSEKFAAMQMQLSMIDARTAEQKSDTKAALDAALAAQKEAVASQTASFNKENDKTEKAATERIKSVETLLTTSTRSTDDKISDIKDRVIAIEAVKLGAVEGAASIHSNSNDTRSMVTSIISVISVIIAAASAIIAILKP